MKTMEELMAELKGLEEKIKAGDDAAIKRGEEIKAEIEKIKAADAKAKKAAGLLSLIGGRDAQDDDTTDEKPAKSVGEAFVRHLRQNPVKGRRFAVTAPAFGKASTDVQTSPTGAVEYATAYDRNVVEAPRTELVIRNLFGAEAISGSALVYLVEGAAEGAPAVTAEGATKSQMHFADPTPKTVTLEKLACFIKESDEYIADYPFLASAINGRLLYALGLAEQNKLVADLLATSGIQTGTIGASATATDIADLILKAAMDVQEASGYAADAIVMNPADWYKLRVEKNANEEYYGGGFFGAQSVPNLWGIPVCVTSAVAADTIIVGAFKTCGSVVSRGGVSVEATNANDKDFEKNLMTIRAEERLALAVRRPAGFKKLAK